MGNSRQTWWCCPSRTAGNVVLVQRQWWSQSLGSTQEGHNGNTKPGGVTCWLDGAARRLQQWAGRMEQMWHTDREQSCILSNNRTKYYLYCSLCFLVADVLIISNPWYLIRQTIKGCVWITIEYRAEQKTTVTTGLRFSQRRPTLMKPNLLTCPLDVFYMPQNISGAK